MTLRNQLVAIGFSISFGIASNAAALAENWNIDPKHSHASFAIKHMMVSNVRGDFSNVQGSASYDGKNLSKAQVAAEIDTTTIDTREPNRDKHLRSKDFFEVEKYPTMTFKSTKIKPLGSGKFEMTGDLTLHGVTKSVVLQGDGPTEEVKDPSGKIRMGASARTKLNRKDFGINYNSVLDNGGLTVGDEVDIVLDIEMIKDVKTAEKAN